MIYKLHTFYAVFKLSWSVTVLQLLLKYVM